MIPLKSIVLTLTILSITNPSTSLNINKDVSNNSKLKKGRILWSYPAKNDTDGTYREEVKRGKRYIPWHYAYPQSPLVEMIMHQTSTVNYLPNSGDPFDFLRDSYPLPKGYKTPLDEYDYVIIGGGTSGSVLASRLTETKPRAMVLVLEAGKPEMLLTDVPALAPYLQQTEYVWPYTYEHQPGICLGSQEERCYSPRGKALGGTSVTDSMIYSRGRPEEWNKIAAEGNYGWSYDQVLEYYKKSERSELKKYKNNPYRGRDGDLSVENVPFKTGLVEAFLQAGRNLGHPTIDYNSPNELGFGYVQVTANKGHRHSSAKAFLHGHKRRRNLHNLTEARATKIVIEPQNRRAYAVDYTKDGKKHTVRCRREIILTAGPIASPQLLMLSGIGPQEHLKELQIPVIANLQVGRQLYDHVAFPGVIFKLSSTNASLLEPKVATLPNLMQWLQFGDGLLTTPGTVEALGYLRTSQARDLLPDIELISLGGSINYDAGGAYRKSVQISDKTYQTAFSPLNHLDTWSAVPVLVQPKSKGYLELRDTNPYSHPKIYGNFLTHRQDRDSLREAIAAVIKLGQSEAFRKYNPQLFLPEYAYCLSYVPGSDEYWDCALRTMAVSARQHVGTCKMGPPTDPEAVVDPELRVYGVDGLRVADSSIIPRPLTAHTGASTVMIGEKAADMIQRTWLKVVS